MNSHPELHLDFATYQAAKFACEKYHYSRVIPAGKLVKFGVWESGQFTGAVIFGRGANSRIGSRYKLQQTECCELVRVALKNGHKTAVTRIVAVALRLLKKHCPGLKLVISYADPEQGHTGVIYQAGNWIYAGESNSQADLLVNGRTMHKRTATSKFGTAAPDEITARTGLKAQWGRAKRKYLYLMPLSDDLRQQVKTMRKKAPKRVRSADSGTP